MEQPKEVKKKGKTTAYRMPVEDAILACKLFAFHEYSKASYAIRMAETGRTMANNIAVSQKISQLRNAWNKKKETVEEFVNNCGRSKTKTKQLPNVIYVLIQNYIVDDPKLPDNFSWDDLEL